jgi:formate hydrogenlyase subunit 3/multisubunit Na+/H+ antiporter MnhD subunit
LTDRGWHFFAACFGTALLIFHPVLHFLPAALLKESLFMGAQSTLRRAGQVARLVFAQERQVGMQNIGDLIFSL